ncbi:HlyD family efflux transporter periplasmic adaptor subunit [Crateriforma conspicua]|uniref:HlyD family efflux transporter periplasmic adaptor subunit n=1 Tax=Crateriforma conspicua TaxID=2527996 RepID=UPI0011898D7B|nr:biotin/lipoyl-binding protein [Crateriforma conspicua]QDV64575.1 HlyD family secretion protein [Crateriforma conspicua]
MNAESSSSSNDSATSHGKADSDAPFRDVTQPGTGEQAEFGSIDSRVAALASNSNDAETFLRRLATDLQQAFNGGIVAVHWHQWSAPVMLVSDPSTSAVIDRDAIRSLLQSASSAAVGCSVPTHDPGSLTRGYHVEIDRDPHRTAVLIVAPLMSPTVGPRTQVDLLRRLSQYASASRTWLRHFQGNAHIDAPETGQSLALSGDQMLSKQSTTNLSTEAARQALRSLHRDLDMNATCYRIVNEARRLLQWDRVTLLRPRGRKMVVSAISSVAVVDRRSNSVASAERLAKAAAVLNRPVILPDADELPPQIQTPLDDYMDQTGVTTCAMLPIHAPTLSSDCTGDDDDDLTMPQTQNVLSGDGRLLGILLLESFEGRPDATIGPSIHEVADEAALALRNSDEHQSVFGLRTRKAIGRVTGSIGRAAWLAAFVILFALLAAAWLVRVDHTVTASGHAEPKIRQQVFAGIDGIVKEILVADGDTVSAGVPLIRLENADLESQVEDLAGRIQTASQRLASLQAMRLDPSADTASQARWALEESQLSSELTGLKSQLDLLQKQQSDLVVTSPIDGRVDAWQIRQRLIDRPVNRGDALLRIVDDQGPWELTLSIVDSDAGPVLESMQDSTTLPLRFAIATEPELSFAGTLQSTATATRLDPQGRYVIDAYADITAQASGFAPWNNDAAMIGADVTAKIQCDRRRLLTSWFSDVIDFVHRHILFHLSA